MPACLPWRFPWLGGSNERTSVRAFAWLFAWWFVRGRAHFRLDSVVDNCVHCLTTACLLVHRTCLDDDPAAAAGCKLPQLLGRGREARHARHGAQVHSRGKLLAFLVLLLLLLLLLLPRRCLEQQINAARMRLHAMPCHGDCCSLFRLLFSSLCWQCRAVSCRALQCRVVPGTGTHCTPPTCARRVARYC